MRAEQREVEKEMGWKRDRLTDAGIEEEVNLTRERESGMERRERRIDKERQKWI